MKKFILILLITNIIFLINCFPYVYHDRTKVLIKEIDMAQTLKIAENELKKTSLDRVLGIWAIRDQIFDKDSALKISVLYFQYIEVLESDFEIWHYAWAISNIYRNADNEMKEILNTAYLDAKTRPEKLKQFKKIADLHINGEKIYMGDVHNLGKRYAKTHIVAPGNKDYLQSYEQYAAPK